MPITDPYVMSKQKSGRVVIITQARVQAEEKQLRQGNLFTPAPSTGPKCETRGCNQRLQSYELGWKKCTKHHRAKAEADRMAQARKTIAAIRIERI